MLLSAHRLSEGTRKKKKQKYTSGAIPVFRRGRKNQHAVPWLRSSTNLGKGTSGGRPFGSAGLLSHGVMSSLDGGGRSTP